MSELGFECVGARPEPHAVSPTLILRLRITEPSGTGVHTIVLRCRVRVEPRRRDYTGAEAEHLGDLFGDIARWGESPQVLQQAIEFATLSVMVPGFTGSTEVDLPVPCGHEMEVAAGKYLASLDHGEIPLLLRFSGTVFARTASGFTVRPVPWDREARYRLPLAVWRELIELCFPGSGWLRLRRDTLRALHRFKSRHALASWDEAVQRLLEEAR